MDAHSTVVAINDLVSSACDFRHLARLWSHLPRILVVKQVSLCLADPLRCATMLSALLYVDRAIPNKTLLSQNGHLVIRELRLLPRMGQTVLLNFPSVECLLVKRAFCEVIAISALITILVDGHFSLRSIALNNGGAATCHLAPTHLLKRDFLVYLWRDVGLVLQA